LGTIYEEKKLYDRSLTEFFNTVKLNPKHQLAHYRAARVLDRLYRSDETVKWCKKFIDLLRDETFYKEEQWCKDRIKQLQLQ
jgi:tetratricopeptide (TPR) repeat protein